jgi:hypothetical protein
MDIYTPDNLVLTELFVTEYHAEQLQINGQQLHSFWISSNNNTYDFPCLSQFIIHML